MTPLLFTESEACTLGVELELQIVNTRDFDLTRGAPDLLQRVQKLTLPGSVKPEITESMIELNSNVCHHYDELLAQLLAMRDALAEQADKLNIAVLGGGTHPFQKWSEQRIYPEQRFNYVSELYGYLAKQYTVFGQHIHIGCADGDDAIYLTHALSRYIPHFIALSASSPFYQGVDTAFDSARLNTVNAFPTSGCMPFVQTWVGFNEYFARMYEYKIVASMKDFYWDIRPKPEYGTVEIRVCDTPLTVARAAQLAAYAQALARMLFEQRPAIPSDIYSLYNYNRFQACRFGMHGYIINPYTKTHVTMTSDILAALKQTAPYFNMAQANEALDAITADATSGQNDTAWLRGRYSETQSLAHVVRAQALRWKGAA